jgi:hypothetical protein
MRRAKTILIVLWAVISAGFAFGSSGIGLEADVSTRYLRRGFVYTDGVVAQYSAWLTISGVEASIWGNAPLKSGRFDEIDPSLGYRLDLSGLSFDARGTYYHYPVDTSRNTVEVILNAVYQLGPGTAHTYHALDLMRHPGAYYGNFGVNYLLPIGAMLILSPGLNAGWSSGKFKIADLEMDVRSLLHAGGDLSLSARLLGIVDVHAQGAINFLIPAAVRQAQGRNATNWNVGLGAAIRL